MSSYKSNTIGSLVIIIGTLIILAIIFLLIFYIGYLNDIPFLIPFGPANDVTSSIESLLTAVLATILIPSWRKKPFWFVVLLVLAGAAWIGAATTTIDLLDAGGIISGVTRAKLRLTYRLGFIATETLHYGIGLQGLWFIGVNLFALLENIWPRKVVFIGLATGLVMVTGLVDGVEINALGSFPEIFWCFWLGRWINSQQTTPEEPLAAATG